MVWDIGSKLGGVVLHVEFSRRVHGADTREPPPIRAVEAGFPKRSSGIVPAVFQDETPPDVRWQPSTARIRKNAVTSGCFFHETEAAPAGTG